MNWLIRLKWHVDFVYIRMQNDPNWEALWNANLVVLDVNLGEYANCFDDSTI
jgi:hypothetical protein